MQAIVTNSEVLDPKVIEWIAKGAKDKDPDVQSAAINALRYMDHPEANDALVTMLRRDKKLRKDPALYEALLIAICQHADPKSFKLIADFKLNDETRETIKARILGIARYRTPEAVEELFDLMKRFGKGRVQPDRRRSWKVADRMDWVVERQQAELKGQQRAAKAAAKDPLILVTLLGA